MSDVPALTQFNPNIVPYQARALSHLRLGYDYNLGTHEVMLSGSVGSAKSLLLAHIALTHCFLWSSARFMLGRLTMPDLKDTIFQTVYDHLQDEGLKEGHHYKVNWTRAKITFRNKSEIISRSWADKKFKKLRSLKLSGAGVEELTENGEEYKGFYPELLARIGRLPHVPETVLVAATNPDSPSHWAYQRFIVPNSGGKKHPTRHVYFSRTTDNPFLKPIYIQQLRENLDPKMARRLVDGEWLDLEAEVIYYAYERDFNFRDEEYLCAAHEPIRLCFDFNIGLGKPMSACAMQHLSHKSEYHYFAAYLIDGADTEEMMEEIAETGLFEKPYKFVVHGDASGKNRDTRSKKTDYAIIREFLAKYRREDGTSLEFEIQVPLANPALRKRHNLVNGAMKNANGRRRLFVYRGAEDLDTGFRLTKLKKGGEYTEDDSFRQQHVTTAAGYGAVSATASEEARSSSRRR